jgi:tRNA(Ile)-lysidine synthase
MRAGELIRKVAATIDGCQMAEPGARILVAVSGGADSVALLMVLHALAGARGFGLTVAHLDHGLRGGAGVRDRRFVEDLAARMGCPCVADSVAVGHGPNLEARARAARHRFLARAARSASCARIALGHTQTDQAETVLLRLLRGAGARGLGGMSPRRGRIIRPLIDCRRADVLAFLEERQASWVEDETNRDERFTRNRVRQRILPVLETEIGPGVAGRLARTATVLRGEDAYLDEVAGQALAGALRGSDLHLDVVRALPAAIRRRTLRLWLARIRGPLGLGWTHACAIERHLGETESTRVSLPGGTARVEGGLLSWTPHVRAPLAPFCVTVKPGARVALAELGWELAISDPVEWSDAIPLPSDTSTAVFDVDTLPRPVVLRSVRPGDRIRPLGLVGTQKLQDLFVNRKVPRSARAKLPLLAGGGEVLWVPGFSRSRHATVGPGTRHVVWAEFRHLR